MSYVWVLLKLLLVLLGLGISVVSFWWNSNMPDPVGPVPFFGGIALFLFAIIVL